MIRIVYVQGGGEFTLSEAARERLRSLLPGQDFTRHGEFDEGTIARTDPALVQIVQELGEDASPPGVVLGIAEVGEGVRYRIRWGASGDLEVVETEDEFLARERPTFFPAREFSREDGY